MTHTTKNTSSTAYYCTTSSFPNIVALETTSTNQKAERPKEDAKQTSHSHKKRVNKSTLIALTAQHLHVKVIIRKTKIAQISQWMFRTINTLPAADSSAETIELIQRWKEIVKLGIYRLTGGKWEKYHEHKFLGNERKVIEERLQQIIRGREQGGLRQRFGPEHIGGFQPQTRRSEQWTVDRIWEVDRLTPTQQQPTTARHARTVVSINGPKATSRPNTNGRGRNRHRDGPRPVHFRTTRMELGMLRGIKERPIRKNGTRPKSSSTGRRQLGP